MSLDLLHLRPYLISIGKIYQLIVNFNLRGTYKHAESWILSEIRDDKRLFYNLLRT